MITRSTRLALLLGLALAVPTGISAQTLPQSTVDRQTISQLQYQLTLPGVTQRDRLEMQEQISNLQYQINTRPPISAPPNTPMATAPLHGSAFPTNPLFADGTTPVAPMNTSATATTNVPRTISTQPANYGYGSCDADARMVQYLTQKVADPTLTEQERVYIPQQIKNLQADMRVRKCS